MLVTDFEQIIFIIVYFCFVSYRRTNEEFPVLVQKVLAEVCFLLKSYFH